MKIKTIIPILFIFSISFMKSQTVVKANLLTALVAIPNIGIETKIGKKSTFQLDLTASFWKSINGAPQQFLIVIPEYRYYTKSIFEGFFVGVHLGGSIFKVQKWNYRNTDRYQEGYGVLLGATIGYQFKFNQKFNAELFFGGGDNQSIYKGYSLTTGERYDGAEGFNKSGEIIPYRLGMMLVYRLK